MDTAGVLHEQTVLVEDGRIVKVGSSGEVAVSAGFLVVEARGRYLLPGLTDVHVHLFDEGELTVYLANGVTTVRNLMGTPGHLEVRERIRSGELLGPRFLTSGSFVNEPQVRTPDQARQAVLDQKAQGFDCIKIHGNVRRDTYEAILATAAEVGLPVVGHVPRNLPVEDVLALGSQADISHGEEYLYTYFDRQDVDANADAVEKISVATRESGIAVVPNLIAYELIVKQVEDLERELAVPELQWVSPLTRLTWAPKYNKYAQSFTPDDFPELRRRFAFLQRFTKSLHDAGVTLLLGSDALNPTAVPGHSAHQELELLVASGLTPYEALRTATANAGAFLAGEPGPATITEGQVADLLLLSADPLVEVANARKIEGVLLGDRWLTREDLDARLGELLSDYERESAFMQRVEIGRLDRAADYYLEQKTKSARAFVFREAGIASLVQVYLVLGKGELAVEAAELYLEEFPDSWGAHARLAEAFRAIGEDELAAEARARAEELRSRD